MLGIVADMLDDLFGIMARQVALRHTNKAAKPARVRCDLQGVTLHFGDGRKARDDGIFTLGLRRLELRTALKARFSPVISRGARRDRWPDENRRPRCALNAHGR